MFRTVVRRKIDYSLIMTYFSFTLHIDIGDLTGFKSELADLPKIINTKLDQGEDRLTQTLVFPKFSYIYIEIHDA